MRTALATAGAAALALTLVITACGGSPARPAAPSGILPTTAVAGLAVATQPLTSQDVQKDSNARDLAARLAGWGYVSGWQRTFQGESRRLTLVVSRSLQFRTSPGAAAFVAYMHQRWGVSILSPLPAGSGCRDGPAGSSGRRYADATWPPRCSPASPPRVVRSPGWRSTGLERVPGC
jgi:hypothetical protein